MENSVLHLGYLNKINPFCWEVLLATLSMQYMKPSHKSTCDGFSLVAGVDERSFNLIGLSHSKY